MNDLSATTQQYVWSKTRSPDRHYELKSGSEVCGVLNFAGGSGSLARAETAHGSWTLKRQGFLSPRVTVRVSGCDDTVGVFTPAWSGGGEFLCRGTGYEVSATGWFRPTWTIRSGGRRVLHTESKGGETLVYLDGGVQPEPDILSLLLVLTVYVPVVAAEDAAVIVAIAG